MDFVVALGYIVNSKSAIMYLVINGYVSWWHKPLDTNHEEMLHYDMYSIWQTDEQEGYTL